MALWITVPVMVINSFVIHGFTETLIGTKSVLKNRAAVIQSAELAKLVHALQEERDQSTLYLSSLGHQSKTYLREAYEATNQKLASISWPKNLNKANQLEYRTNDSFYYHLEKHRLQLANLEMTIFEDMNFYSDDIQIMITWLHTALSVAKHNRKWKSLVAYENMVSAKETAAMEKTLGGYYFSNGKFQNMDQYSTYIRMANVFKKRYSTARKYSKIVPPISISKSVEGRKDLADIIDNYRLIIINNDNITKSMIRAVDWLDNMALYIDHLFDFQKEIEDTIITDLRSQTVQMIFHLLLYSVLLLVVSIAYILLLRGIFTIVNDIHQTTTPLTVSKKELVSQKKETDALLYHVIPRHIADQFKAKSGAHLKKFDNVTVLFTNIVGFTRDVRLTCDPDKMANLLNDIEEFFDERIKLFNVYKLETIGESHMVVAGIPEPNVHHCAEMSNFALDLLDKTARFHLEDLPTGKLNLRIGIHSGPVIAGLACLSRPRYAVFGLTVVIAAHHENNGRPGAIHISSDTHALLAKEGYFQFEIRPASAQSRNRNIEASYFLTGKRNTDLDDGCQDLFVSDDDSLISTTDNEMPPSNILQPPVIVRHGHRRITVKEYDG